MIYSSFRTYVLITLCKMFRSKKFSNELEFIFQNNLENGVSEDEAFESVVDNLTERLSSLNVFLRIHQGM